MKNPNVRFRRLDAQNFVIERKVEAKGERSESTKEWVIEGYYSDIRAMLRSAVGTVAWGDCGAELVEAVKNGTSALQAAFERSVKDGLLSSDGGAA